MVRRSFDLRRMPHPFAQFELLPAINSTATFVAGDLTGEPSEFDAVLAFVSIRFAKSEAFERQLPSQKPATKSPLEAQNRPPNQRLKSRSESQKSIRFVQIEQHERAGNAARRLLIKLQVGTRIH